MAKNRKRLMRLMPMASISVVVCLLVEFSYKLMLGNNMLWGKWYTLPQIITSILLVGNGWFVEWFPLVNNPIWYLCILIVLTILFILINETVKDRSIKLIIYAMMASIGLIGYKLQVWIPFLYLSNCRGYAAFYIGVLLFEIVHKRFKENVIILGSALWFIVGCMTIIVTHRVDWYIFVLTLFPALVLLATELPQIKNKYLQIGGGISFEIYLWHVPLYCLIKWIFDVNHIVINHTYLTMVGYVAMVCGLAAVQYFVVEQNINKVVKRIRTNRENLFVDGC